MPLIEKKGEEKKLFFLGGVAGFLVYCALRFQFLRREERKYAVLVFHSVPLKKERRRKESDTKSQRTI
jgi:hypothetical protein